MVVFLNAERMQDLFQKHNSYKSVSEGKYNVLVSRVDPLTSILAVVARSCQILTTSWQPWIPWQDSY